MLKFLVARTKRRIQRFTAKSLKAGGPVAKAVMPYVRQEIKARIGNDGYKRIRAGYNAIAPVARSTISRTLKARQRSTNRGETIAHRELLGTINGSVAFTIQGTYSLNPGLAATFPWLSVQAARWQQYRFNRLRFDFVTRAPTTKLGSLLLAPEYNSATAAPADELSMSAMQGCIESNSWSNVSLALDQKSMNVMGSRHFIRTGNVAGDVKTYDSGTLYLATVEQDNADSIGKLWVEYEVELFNPVIANPTMQPKCYAMLTNSAPFNIGATTAFYWLKPADVDVVVTDSVGVVAQANDWLLPQGTYAMHVELVITTGNVAGIQEYLGQYKSAVLQDGSVSEGYLSNGTVHGYLASMYYMQVNGTQSAGAQIQCTYSAGTASCSRVRIMFHCV